MAQRLGSGQDTKGNAGRDVPGLLSRLHRSSMQQPRCGPVFPQSQGNRFFKLAPLNGKNDDLSLVLSLLTLVIRTNVVG